MTVRMDMGKAASSLESSQESDATGGLGQAGNLAGLFGRAIGEEVVQVLAVAFFFAKFFANGLGQDPHGGGNLVLVVVLAQEVDDFPVVVRERHFFFFGQVSCGLGGPFGQVQQVAFFVGFVGLAVDFKTHGVLQLKINIGVRI